MTQNTLSGCVKYEIWKLPIASVPDHVLFAKIQPSRSMAQTSYVAGALNGGFTGESAMPDFISWTEFQDWSVRNHGYVTVAIGERKEELTFDYLYNQLWASYSGLTFSNSEMKARLKSALIEFNSIRRKYEQRMETQEDRGDPGGSLPLIGEGIERFVRETDNISVFKSFATERALCALDALRLMSGVLR